MNNYDIKYPIGINKSTGEIIHINDYVEEHHKNQIICPQCGKKMIAKAINSYKVVNHFAHVSLENCFGYETILHKWAKQSFLSYIGETIKIPSILDTFLSKKTCTKLKNKIEKEYKEYRETLENKIRESKIFINGWYFPSFFNNKEDLFKWIRDEFCIYTNKSFEEISIPHYILIESAEIEVKNNNVISDVLINQKYAIEIFVTHKIDDAKEKLLNDISLNTIEIDLSKKHKIFFDKNDLKTFILKETINKKVFGNFTDIRNNNFSIDKINMQEFETFLIQKAKNMLDKEILEKIEKQNNCFTTINNLIQSNPPKFFVDHILNNSILEVRNDYKLIDYANKELIKLGFPLLDKDNNRNYTFPLEGNIVNINNIEELNRLKLKFNCNIFIDNYKQTFTVNIIMKKKQYNSIKENINNIKFFSIKKGWNGVELIFD